MNQPRFTILFFLIVALSSFESLYADDQLFENEIAPILERSCLQCHNDTDPQGEFSLETFKATMKGGESGEVIEPGDPDSSLLIDYITGPEPEMPKKGKPLSNNEIALIKKWIESGAEWPEKIVLQEAHLKENSWWSFQPIQDVVVPELSPEDRKKVRTPIDAFLISRLKKEGLTFSEEANRRTLIRRVYFDLIGLPPTPEEVEKFVKDENPNAYSELVEKLLASERYGERWARHWLDTVHYADTHGYDKDKLRPNAWPYRDYVIRSFNEDKKYSDFVMEQVAGDMLKPGDPNGLAAVGFLVTGPFDWVGQIEVGEDLIEKKITRNLDRDDMVSVTLNTFQSVTVQCARCHNHKFDPITQEDYYKQQAIFAAIDKADRDYDADPSVAKNRIELKEKKTQLKKEHETVINEINRRSGGELVTLDREISKLKSGKMSQSAAFGYHSQIEKKQDNTKWVQLDLKNSVTAEEIVLIPAYDNYNNIGAGFGFPARYRVEVSSDPKFKKDVKTLLDLTEKDQANPGSNSISVTASGESFRYLRVTATRLAERQNDYIFALGEIQVRNREDENLARQANVQSLDSIEAPPRWQKKNLVDGEFYTFDSSETKSRLEELTQKRETIYQKVSTRAEREKLDSLEQELSETETAIESLPPQSMIFTAATDFDSRGNFKPTKGTPRPVYLLHRGSEKNPVKEVGPAGLRLISAVSSDFQLEENHPEGERRLALAKFLVDGNNALTWRSIVNRVWQYHFGQGIVNTPNDFGKMGALPSHPELLDWLAKHFRDEGQSIKNLHRLILNSHAYRQVSSHNEKGAEIDAGNRLLWRMNRRKLDAEAIRDSVLAVSGKLNLKMYGPGYHLFEIEKPEHSPHYLYEKHNPNEESTHRRTVYRFVVRSVPDPFMDSLDCANPSQAVPKRMQTLTALQALSLLNDKFMVSMSSNFAERLKSESENPAEQIKLGYQLCFGRNPSEDEQILLEEVTRKHGLENTCRLLLNTNEFMFID